MAIDLPREQMAIIALAAKARSIRPHRPHTLSTEIVTDVSGHWLSQWPLNHWHKRCPPIDDVVLLCCCLSVCCNTGNKYLNLNRRKGTVLCSYVGIRLFWKELPSIAIMVCQMQLMNHHKPHPHSNTLHSMTKMPPMPTSSPLGSSSPSPQEWTHRPILNYLPDQEQDPLHPRLDRWLFDTWFASNF
jgi:hypothetical protein